MRSVLYTLLFLALSRTALPAEQMAFTVRLTEPLSAATARRGDPVTARIQSPENFRGDALRGRIMESRSGGNAELDLAFDTLEHQGRTVPISAKVLSLTNSRGQRNVDEDGHSVSQTNRTGNERAARQIGASFSGFLGGRKGDAVNTAADVAAALATIRLSVPGPNLSLAAGSELGVSVDPRGGPELSTLPANPRAPATPETAAASEPPAPASRSAETPANSSAASSSDDAQPDLKAVKIDFIPGDKTVFYDDFTDMAEDEPPPHWKLRDGKVELRTGNNIRQLTTVCPARLSLSSQSFKFPKDFTVEIEAVFSDEQSGMDFFAWPHDVEGGEAPSWRIDIDAQGISMKGPKDDSIGDHDFRPSAVNRPVKIALWVQNGRARGYVDGERIADVNQMVVPAGVSPADHWTIRERCDRPGDSPGSSWMGIRSVRVAESAPDFSSMIASSGKYVSHGILFETDSDRLRPESAPVLRAVVQALQKNPNLKLEIDGYTDSTGDAAHNLELSKKRGEAVRSVLVSQFNVEAARLSSNGFGAAKPIGSNDTAEGRAQNRRVEFIRK